MIIPLFYITKTQCTLRHLMYQEVATMRRANGVDYTVDPYLVATPAEVKMMRGTHAPATAPAKIAAGKFIYGEMVDPRLSGLVFTDCGGVSFRSDHVDWRANETFTFPVEMTGVDFMGLRPVVSLNKRFPGIGRVPTPADYRTHVSGSVDYSIAYRVICGATTSFFDCRYVINMLSAPGAPTYGHFGTIKENPGLFLGRVRVLDKV